MKFKRFGLGIAKGMALTFEHLFRRPITTQYPEKRITPSKRIRGNEFVWFPDRCTGCGTCAKSCPQGSIEIVTAQAEEDKYLVVKFEIDIGRSMFCGLCVESCPFDALYMGCSYEMASYQRAKLFLGKEELLPEMRSPSAYAHPRLEPLLPKQSLLLDLGKKEG